MLNFTKIQRCSNYLLVIKKIQILLINYYLLFFFIFYLNQVMNENVHIFILIKKNLSFLLWKVD